MHFYLVISLFGFFLSCSGSNTQLDKNAEVFQYKAKPNIEVGADDHEAYLPLLKGKKIGLVVNQTSRKGEQHVVDFLMDEKQELVSIFAPEHGFRGKADAGGKIEDGKDEKTGLPLYSLYGKSKKPSPEQMAELDMMIFDIQDVGARFYTYISTLHYVMEACADAQVPLMIFDRPNPNGHYVDGPIMEKEFSSFVGLHPIPIVHGMTIGEYAQMINGENWLGAKKRCTLIVIKCKNYDHSTYYRLPIKPSPNLPNNKAIFLYPSLCLFEGTTVSVGRGTDKQFQVIGHPSFESKVYNFSFTPVPKEGASNPKHNGVPCQGLDYSAMNLGEFQSKKSLMLGPLIEAYQNFEKKEDFFNSFFNKLAGTATLQEMIKAGKSEEEIKSTWASGLVKFKEKRKKYLLYDSLF